MPCHYSSASDKRSCCDWSLVAYVAAVQTISERRIRPRVALSSSSNKVHRPPKDASVVSGILLFWSWYVQHATVIAVYACSNMLLRAIIRLRTCHARFSICPSSTLTPRITHRVYHILGPKTCFRYGHSFGSYIPQCRDRSRYPSTFSVRCFVSSACSAPLMDISCSQIPRRQAKERPCPRIFHGQKGEKSTRGSSMAKRN